MVLTASAAAAALAIALVGEGRAGRSGVGTTNRAPAPGRQQACVTTHAQAEVSMHGSVTSTATASVPVRVLQTASGRAGVITVTRGGIFRSTVRATRHLAVKQRSVAAAHDCATGSSLQAAKGLAIRHAFALAKVRAHRDAVTGAKKGLTALEHRVYPQVRAQARAAAQRRAAASAQAGRPALVRHAHQEAVKRAR